MGLADVYTDTPAGEERPVNAQNEWGGYSRKLGMPVFTAWSDKVEYDKQTKLTTAVVCDDAWKGRPVGLPNQQRWIQYALDKHDGVAAFFIIHPKQALDSLERRTVQFVDDMRSMLNGCGRTAE